MVYRSAIVGVVLMFLMSWAGPASAHSQGNLGEFDIEIGFGDEPAYAGQPNSMELQVSHDGEPVADIGNLEAEVQYGDQVRQLELEPNFAKGGFGDVGDFRAWFIPTRPGKYTFRLYGSVPHDDGVEKVDESFTSGPDTFAEVQNPSSAQFPEADPTDGELAARAETESARIDSMTSAVNTARLLAIAGLVVGAAALAMALRRRKV